MPNAYEGGEPEDISDSLVSSDVEEEYEGELSEVLWLHLGFQITLYFTYYDDV